MLQDSNDAAILENKDKLAILSIYQNMMGVITELDKYKTCIFDIRRGFDIEKNSLQQIASLIIKFYHLDYRFKKYEYDVLLAEKELVNEIKKAIAPYYEAVEIYGEIISEFIDQNFMEVVSTRNKEIHANLTLSPKPIFKQPYLSKHAKELAQKMAKLRWNILSDFVSSKRYKSLSNRQMLQLSVSHISMLFKNIEDSLMIEANNQCKHYYQLIKIKFDAHINWLNFLKNVYQQAQNNVETVLGKIDSDIKSKRETQTKIALGVLEFALAPLGLNLILAPILTAAKTAYENKDDIANVFDSIDEYFNQDDFPNSLTPEPLNQNEAPNVIEALNLAIKYCEHKQNGVVKQARDLFNEEILKNSIRKELSPRKIIRLVMASHLAQIKRNNYFSWDLFVDNAFFRLSEQLKYDSASTINRMIDAIFKPIVAQYEQVAESVQFSSLIERIEFDDDKVGKDSIQSQDMNILRTNLMKSIESAMLIASAESNTNFFGANGEFWRGLYAGKKSTAILKEIISRIDFNHFPDNILKPEKLNKNKEAIREKLFKKLREQDTLKYCYVSCTEFFCCRSNYDNFADTYFDSQRKRRKILTEIQAIFNPEKLEELLKLQIIEYAAKKEIECSEEMQANSNANVNGWVAENKLLELTQQEFSEIHVFNGFDKLINQAQTQALDTIHYWNHQKRKIAYVSHSVSNVMVYEVGVQTDASLHKRKISNQL